MFVITKRASLVKRVVGNSWLCPWLTIWYRVLTHHTPQITRDHTWPQTTRWANKYYLNLSWPRGSDSRTPSCPGLPPWAEYGVVTVSHCGLRSQEIFSLLHCLSFLDSITCQVCFFTNIFYFPSSKYFHFHRGKYYYVSGNIFLDLPRSKEATADVSLGFHYDGVSEISTRLQSWSSCWVQPRGSGYNNISSSSTELLFSVQTSLSS